MYVCMYFGSLEADIQLGRPACFRFRLLHYVRLDKYSDKDRFPFNSSSILNPFRTCCVYSPSV